MILSSVYLPLNLFTERFSAKVNTQWSIKVQWGQKVVDHRVILQVLLLRNHGGSKIFIIGAFPLWETESKKKKKKSEITLYDFFLNNLFLYYCVK